MSDAEEPPTKLSKMEDPPTPETLEGLGTEDESMMEEGQEEWLSEEVLTDEEFNPTLDNDKNDSNFGNISQISQDENLPINDLIEQLDSSINTDQEEEETVQSTQVEDTVKDDLEVKGEQDSQDNNEETISKDITTDTNEESKNEEQTIEETLNNFEGPKSVDSEDVKPVTHSKTDGDVVQAETDDKNKVEKSEDDGNDTDDLLRMLGEDENRSKKKVMKISADVKVQNDQSSDDDEDDGFVYDGAQVRTMKVQKYALVKKYPATKAEPENMSDGDDESDLSSDEASTMQKMFEVKPPKSSCASKGTAKPSSTQTRKHSTNMPAYKSETKPQQSVLKQYQNKHILKSKMAISSKSNMINSQKNLDSSKSENHSKSELTSRKSELNTSKPGLSTSKPGLNTSKPGLSTSKPGLSTSKPGLSTSKPGLSTSKPELNTRKSDLNTSKSELNTSKSDGKLSKFDALKASMSKLKDETEEIIDGEEFLEDDEDFDLDEDEFAEESDLEDQSKSKQKLMKPESMDEEIPSDEESRSEDGSLYDELPSSESEDLEDWFKLDIRAERAADYLPFLGSKAHELLQEEKRRVSSRLQTLRQSLTALTDSARVQADQIRDATMTLAELDDMLKAT